MIASRVCQPASTAGLPPKLAHVVLNQVRNYLYYVLSLAAYLHLCAVYLLRTYTLRASICVSPACVRSALRRRSRIYTRTYTKKRDNSNYCCH